MSRGELLVHQRGLGGGGAAAALREAFRTFRAGPTDRSRGMRSGFIRPLACALPAPELALLLDDWVGERRQIDIQTSRTLTLTLTLTELTLMLDDWVGESAEGIESNRFSRRSSPAQLGSACPWARVASPR